MFEELRDCSHETDPAYDVDDAWRPGAVRRRRRRR
jgi:hypothetical protein